MNRGEIYRTGDRTPERGGKPGYYVIVSRRFIAQNDDVGTVICAPIYSQVLGIATEVVVGPDDGLPHESAVRCDFLCLMFKRRLKTLVSRLSDRRLAALDRALDVALDLTRSMAQT